MKCAHEAKLALLNAMLEMMQSELAAFTQADGPIGAYYTSLLAQMRLMQGALHNAGELHRHIVHSAEEGHVGESALFAQDFIEHISKSMDEFFISTGTAKPPVDPSDFN